MCISVIETRYNPFTSNMPADEMDTAENNEAAPLDGEIDLPIVRRM
jgi:hypothetical protein